MTHEETFRAFHEQNPHVYAQLVAMCRQARAAGHQKVGIGMLWEVLRWQRMFQTNHSVEDYKLNNNHRSHYARLILEREPDLEGIFEIRQLLSE